MPQCAGAIESKQRWDSYDVCSRCVCFCCCFLNSECDFWESNSRYTRTQVWRQQSWWNECSLFYPTLYDVFVSSFSFKNLILSKFERKNMHESRILICVTPHEYSVDNVCRILIKWLVNFHHLIWICHLICSTHQN